VYVITPDEIVRSAFDAFHADAETLPPLTLRGGNAVDSYDNAEPFDAARDEPTDAYIEAYAFWGLGERCAPDAARLRCLPFGAQPRPARRAPHLRDRRARLE
jgi:hypothetical protein